MSKITDPQQHVTTIVNNPEFGKPETITYPGGATRSYEYWEPSTGISWQLRSMTDERGKVTHFDRHEGGRLLWAVRYPDGSEERWPSYNAFAQPLSHILKNGATERFEYDSMGRMLVHWLPSFE